MLYIILLKNDLQYIQNNITDQNRLKLYYLIYFI